MAVDKPLHLFSDTRALRIAYYTDQAKYVDFVATSAGGLTVTPAVAAQTITLGNAAALSVGGTLGVTGVATFSVVSASQSVQVTGTGSSPGQAGLNFDAANGLQIRGKVGTVTDLLLVRASDGVSVLGVPTGTRDIGIIATAKIYLDGVAGTGDTYIFESAANTVAHVVGGVSRLVLDNDATATNTALRIYDVDNAQLERVSVGSADSGGAGFKVLRIPN